MKKSKSKSNSSDELPTNLHKRADLVIKEKRIEKSHAERLPKLCEQYGLTPIYQWAYNAEITDWEIEDAVYKAIEDMAIANMVQDALKRLRRNIKSELR